MWLNSLILAGIAQAIFLLLMLKAGKKKAGIALLMTWLVIFSLQLLFYYDDLSVHPLAPQTLALLGFALPLLSSAALYLYIYSRSFRPRKLWPHALPYLIYVLILLLQPVTAVNDGYPHFSPVVPGWLANGLLYMLAVVPAIYVLLTVLRLWRSQRALALSFALLFVGLFALIRLGTGYGPASNHLLFAVVGALLSLYVFFIAYLTLRPVTAPAYQNSGLSAADAQTLFMRATAYMQQEKPFLNETLTLDELAARLNVPAHRLSQAVNQSSGESFLLWLNRYRVEAVKERLNDPAFAHYSILGIAYDCGFRSKSVFNKVFKEVTGETPSAWRNKGLSLSVRTTDAAG